VRVSPGSWGLWGSQGGRAGPGRQGPSHPGRAAGLRKAELLALGTSLGRGTAETRLECQPVGGGSSAGPMAGPMAVDQQVL